MGWIPRRCAVALVLLVAACGDGGGAASGRGGTLAVGMRSDFQPLNPITAGDQYTVELINYGLFTPLVQYDSALNVQPFLAQRWQLTDTSVTFTLRRDVRWHDGRPVTAEDVKFTFDLAKDPSTASLIGSAYVPNVKSASVVDSFTIHFSFVRPHAQALEDFWWAPAPKHLLQNVAPADMRNAPYNQKPIGSGPYRFVEWLANERLVLERNPDYPAALGGPPQVDRMVLRVIPEPSTMIAELITGGVHVDVPVAPDQTQQLKENDQIDFFAFPGKTVFYIGWNNQREPFTSSAVRRALAMAVNRADIINALLLGQGTAATSTVPPWHPLYPENAAVLPYDVAAANRLLDSLGWRDSNGDGVRDRNGRPFRFTLMTADYPLNRSVAEVLQSQFAKIGVAAQIRVLEFQTLLAQHRARDFDAVFTSWVLDNFQMASAPEALFHSKNAAVPNSTNRSAVRIPELDRLIDQASRTTDLAAARPLWRQMTEVLQREQPVTFVYWLYELAAARKEVSGVIMDPRGELLSMQQWSLR